MKLRPLRVIIIKAFNWRPARTSKVLALPFERSVVGREVRRARLSYALGATVLGGPVLTYTPDSDHGRSDGRLAVVSLCICSGRLGRTLDLLCLVPFYAPWTVRGFLSSDRTCPVALRGTSIRPNPH